MGMAPAAHVLFNKFMSFNPKNPTWYNRDRFVLSNGHACALQYAVLHLFGYKVSIDDLKKFRTIDSICPGLVPSMCEIGWHQLTTGFPTVIRKSMILKASRLPLDLSVKASEMQWA